MSVRIPILLAGVPETRPTIHFTLTQLAEGVAIEAKHSEDGHSQTIIEIGFNECGQLECRTRDLHSPKLLEIASIEKGEGLRTRFVSKSMS